MTQTEAREAILAQALRDYPTWGDAYIAEKHRADECSRVLLNVEGAILAYWTDIPEAELEQLRVLIRETLGDFEPRGERDEPPEGYVIPEGDARCDFVMDACVCMKRKGHDGLHACAHGVWRGAANSQSQTGEP